MKKALINLANIAICTSNDLHCLHFGMQGAEFDTLHKKVLQKYYTQAADDADTWAEAACMFGADSVNFNDSAVGWVSVPVGIFNRERVVDRTTDLLTSYCAALLLVFDKLNKESTIAAVGVANTLQTQIEYWSKELLYFNARR
jgi:DNA-binding ferritin-like protein